MAVTIGIDVHKDLLMLAVHQGSQWTTANTPTGRAQLVDRLRGLAPARIVLEPSGGYERPVLAAYGAIMTPPLTMAPSPAATRLADRTGRRRQLTETAAAEQRRRDTAGPESHASIQRHLAFLEAEITDLTAQISVLVDADPTLQRRRRLLCSVPGIGLTTAQLLLAELGTLTPKALASLVGVAPLTQQSGAAAGTARIDGGRRQVRTGLWMPTLTAMRFNPVIRAVRDRLAAAHQPHKVVTIACMRAAHHPQCHARQG